MFVVLTPSRPPDVESQKDPIGKWLPWYRTRCKYLFTCPGPSALASSDAQDSIKQCLSNRSVVLVLVELCQESGRSMQVPKCLYPGTATSYGLQCQEVAVLLDPSSARKLASTAGSPHRFRAKSLLSAIVSVLTLCADGFLRRMA